MKRLTNPEVPCRRLPICWAVVASLAWPPLAGAQVHFDVRHVFATPAPINPDAKLLLGSDGNFYGTTSGVNQYPRPGAIFKMTPAGAITVLHKFTGVASDGQWPQGGLILANDGNMYGTTSNGGTHGDGTVFRLTASGVVSTLYSFNYAETGGLPEAAVLQGTDGSLYGTTGGGGGSGHAGTAFRLTLAGSFSVLHAFGAPGDGASPIAALIQIGANFYGTTESGGSSGFGTIFRMTSDGVVTILHSFNYSDGAYPEAGLVAALDGNMYGVATAGGAAYSGTAFRIAPDGSDFTVLHYFNSAMDG